MMEMLVLFDLVLSRIEKFITYECFLCMCVSVKDLESKLEEVFPFFLAVRIHTTLIVKERKKRILIFNVRVFRFFCFFLFEITSTDNCFSFDKYLNWYKSRIFKVFFLLINFFFLDMKR